MVSSPRSVAVEAALTAGAILRELYGRTTKVRFKGAVDLVTEADERSERAVVEIIERNFPDHRILTEEGGEAHRIGPPSRCRWIIDPLDGTTNFSHSYPFFCVSIAYEVDGALKLGVVYEPLFDELFLAVRGGGATLNGIPIAVSRTSSLMQALLSTGFQYDREIARRNLVPWEAFLVASQAVRRDGSAALDLCYVAAGRYDGYWESGLSPWDCAAGSLMVSEAGGLITDFDGQPFYLDAPNCLAANPTIHPLMRRVLAEPGRDRGR